MKKASIITVALFVFVIVPIVFAMRYAPVYCDSAYYLSIVNKVSEGKVLYDDITCAYTPLFFVICAKIKQVLSVSNTSYQFWLGVNFFILLLLSYVTALIVNKMTCRKSLARLTFFIVFFSLFRDFGDCVLLEGPSALFGMLSVFVIIISSLRKQIRRHCTLVFLSGIMTMCAFLIKQFGAGFLFLDIILIMMISEERERIKDIIVYCIGAIGVFCLFFVISPHFLQNIYDGYGFNSVALDANRNDVFLRNLPTAYYDLLIKRFICLAIAIFLPFSSSFRKKFSSSLSYGNKMIFIVSIIGIIGFMFSFYIRYSHHYFIYVIPFASVVVVVLLNVLSKTRVRDNRKSFLHVLYLLTFILSSLYYVNCVYRNKIYYSYIVHSEKEEQTTLSQSLNKKRISGPIYIYNADLMPFYYLNSLDPPVINGKLCYMFGDYMYKEEDVKKKIESSQYVIFYDDVISWESRQYKILDSYGLKYSEIGLQGGKKVFLANTGITNEKVNTL